MVLISVDLPHPLGPRIATCSSAPMHNVKLSSAIFCPRITQMLRKSNSGAAGALCMSSPRYQKPRTENCSTLKPDAASDLPPATCACRDYRALRGTGGRHVFLCPLSDA